MGAFADARHVLAVHRAQRAVLARSPRPAMSRWRAVNAWFWLGIPLVVVMTAWEDARTGGDLWLRKWAFFACLAVLAGSGQFFLMDVLSFSPRDVLFHPSKAGVLLARLVQNGWRFAVIGAGWAFACFLHASQVPGTPAIAIATCCAVAFLAPLAWNVGNLLRRIVAPDTHSPPLSILVVLAGFAYGLGESLFGTGLTTGPHWSLVLIVGFAAMALLAGTVVAWWRAPRAELRALWPDVVRLPRVFVMFVLFAPASWLREHLVLLTAFAMPWIVVFSSVGLRHLLVVVNGVEAETRGAAIRRVTEHDVPQETEPPRRAALPPHRGRSPSLATWRLHWLRHGITWRDLWRPVVVSFLLRHGTIIAVAAGLVANPEAPAVLLLFIALPLPVSYGIVSRERLYLLGVDLRKQARQQVLTVLWSAALPALLAGALVGTSCGWNESRAGMLAALAASFVVRVGWRGLLPRPESVSTRAAVTLALLLSVATGVAAAAKLVVQWPIVGAFAALGLVGLVRRILLWREPELLADLVAERERESRPAA